MLKTFKRCGIHPDDKKALSKDAAIKRMPMPSELVIPLSMSIGAASKPIIELGSEVVRGQLIAEKASAVSSNISSPSSGVYKELRKISLPTGVSCNAMVIETRENPPDSNIFNPISDAEFNALTKAEIINRIEAAGIVGMGGATFPAPVKYSVKDGSIDYLLINACECEPYLTCDYRLLVEKKDRIIVGIRILKRLLEPKNTIFCTEANKKDETAELMSMAKGEFKEEILKSKYPQGDEKSIVEAITKREVPSGKLPLDVGCIVINLATLVAVCEAVTMSKPLIERVVTITGEGAKSPSNLLVPIGAKVGDVIDFAGGITEDADKLIMGGPMMGFAFYDLNTPIIKGTGAITILNKEKKRAEFPCISCGSCVNACPMGLLPTTMYKNIKAGNVKEAVELNLLDCRECGCCEYSCPSNLRLVQMFKMGKQLWSVKK